jgi:hypothetical protein
MNTLENMTLQCDLISVRLQIVMFQCRPIRRLIYQESQQSGEGQSISARDIENSIPQFASILTQPQMLGMKWGSVYTADQQNNTSR